MIGMRATALSLADRSAPAASHSLDRHRLARQTAFLTVQGDKLKLNFRLNGNKALPKAGGTAMWQSVASILGYGAIGLGFLLAVLTYRLLRKGPENNTPIYVYEVFCFALVIVGAFLQWSSNNISAGALMSQIDTLQSQLKEAKGALSKAQLDLDSTKDNLNRAQTQAKSAESQLDTLKDASNKLAETQGSLQSTEQKLRAAQQEAGAAKSKGDAATKTMAAIVRWIPGAIEELQQVNGTVTGIPCGGGANGTPIIGGGGAPTYQISSGTSAAC